MAHAGRPSEFNQDMADLLCQELSMGKSLRTVCFGEDRPAISTFFRWMRDYPQFRKQYEVAKQEASDAMAEEIMDIADDGTNDYLTKERPDGTTFEVVNSEHVQRSRLRIDTRKWLMAKMKPKKYGDKLDLTSDGKVLPTPIYGGKSTQ